jgi:hypothetical protein
MARRKPQICKVDSNHAPIVNELRALGLSVVSLAKVANGCPDISVGWNGVNYLFEIKVEGETLNEVETKWHQAWQGQVATIHSSEEALVTMEMAGAKLTLQMQRHLLA